MSMIWSSALYLLLLLPLIIAAYIWALRWRRRFVIRYSSLSLVREAAAHQSWWRRHVPFILFLFALVSLILALARPTAEIVVPSNRATIILAMDVSRSMCSTDIPPNRLIAAQEAATEFVQTRNEDAQIGIVAFAGFAELIQPPTKDSDMLVSAIENLVPARRTAIGSAILRSIDAIAEIDNRIPPTQLNAKETPNGEFAPHIIVLLTDGSNNAGPSPFNAANQAAARGIRVYTIGFGTVNNTSPMNCGDVFSESDQFGGPGFGLGFGGGGGGGFRRELDEVTLKQVADMTGGTYYAATSARELQDVFRNLPTYLVVMRETTEVSAFFNTLGLLLILLAIFLSLRWNPVL
ncbi:MAG TPA: VWA domain-containing protein [Anaerolineales bacterium]|nr:VWA domain-containing protein [Anaerolineales bacterium]HNQ96186.1 VWA domain-containing protein [Anaerolineales bacterium]HNS62013.1 VWA domain-containing protein [Anaerolineales bacterium]